MTGYVTIADLQRACPLLIVAGTSTRSQCGLQASVATLDFPHRFWHGSSYSYRCIHSLSWRCAHLAAARTFITVRLRARLLVVSNAPRPTNPNSNVFGFALSPVRCPRARGSVRRPQRQWLRPAGRADCAGRVAPAGDGSAVPACGLAPFSRQRRPAGSAIRARRRVTSPARR